MKFHIITALNRDLPLFTEGFEYLIEELEQSHGEATDLWPQVNLLATADRPFPSLGTFWGIKKTGVTTYDQAMIWAKKNIRVANHDQVILLDNDCFIYDTYLLKEVLLERNIDQRQNFLGYFVNQQDYKEEDKIRGFYRPKQKFLPSKDIYGFVPDPHWENAFCVIPGHVWNLLSPEDCKNTRELWKAISGLCTMEAFHVEHKLTYSHHGPGFFHIGNLMGYIHRLEQGDFSLLNEGQLPASRIGCLMKNEAMIGQALYGDLRPAMEACGGRFHCIEAWNELVNHIPSLRIDQCL